MTVGWPGDVLGVGGRTRSTDPANTDGSNVDVGGCKTVSILISRCLEVFEADADTLALFGVGGVRAWDLRPFHDFSTLPAFDMYATSVGSQLAPTKLDLTDVEIFFGVRFDAREMHPLKAWEPGVSSAISTLQRVLLGPLLLAPTIFVGDECVRLSIRSQPGASAVLVDEQQDTGRFAVTRQFSHIWHVTDRVQSGIPSDLARVLP